MKKNGVVVGFGGMGNWHANYFLKSDVVNLAGIFDIADEPQKKAEEKGFYVYSSLQEVLDDKNVDFITIATPNNFHKEIAIKALAAGKHVICEKPVTVSSDDLQAMIAASEKYDRIFTVHQNRRWDSDFLMMKDIYKNGLIGNAFNIVSNVYGSRGIPGDWRAKEEFGGGMLLDWGVHLIDQVINIVYDKKLKSVYCRFDHITNKEVDDGFKLDMYFEGDLTVRLEVATSHFISMPRFYMAGNLGTAMIQGWTTPCKVVTCKKFREENVLPVVTAAGITKTMAPRQESNLNTYELPLPKEDVHDFYRNIVKAMDGKEEQIVTHKQMMRVMKIMEAAFESDRTAAIVKFDDVLA